MPLLLMLGLGAVAYFVWKSQTPHITPGPAVTVDMSKPHPANVTVGVGQQLQVVLPAMNWQLGQVSGVSATAGQDDGKSPLIMVADYGGPQGKVFAFKAIRPGNAAFIFGDGTTSAPLGATIVGA